MSSFFGVFLLVLMLTNVVNSQSISNECGRINIPKGLTIQNNQTRKGFWPFAVAIYEIKEYKLFCGGTLISRQHVLTAAHCVQDNRKALKYSPNEIAVLLGAFILLAKSEGGVKQANITNILIHPDWEMIGTAPFDADVAILVLSESVRLTNDIQVACLPSDFDTIDNAKGFVVGWDYLVQQSPKHSLVNVYNYSQCYAGTHVLSSYLPSRTFCGGAEETSILKKTSGGGFFVATGSSWIQYGVAVLVTNVTDNATNETLVSFMNVALFKNWIIDAVRQSGGVIGEAIQGRISLECDFIHLYYSYACAAHSLNVLSKNFGVDKIIGTHPSVARDNDPELIVTLNNSHVELIQFHNGTMFYLVDGIGIFFPKLKSFLVGYSDSDALNTKLIKRSNFQNMENLFEIVIHRSQIEIIAEDLLWDLPNLERFQLDGMLLDIPERLFENNAKLQEVYLASNALVSLPKNLFKFNLDLKWVNFSDNYLNYIYIDFLRLPNIQYVFLTGNRCIDKSFNKTAVQSDDSLEDLEENNDSNQVGRVITLQRLIYWNCTYFTK